MIHTTLVKFLKANNLSVLSPDQQEQAKGYLEEDSSKTVYRSDADTLQNRLALIGGFIMEILAAYQDTAPVYGLLHRLFDEQNTIEDGKALLRDKKSVKADCHFLQDAIGNSERVTASTIEDLYADGAYQSPENREFAKSHDDMQLKTGKMQGGCRWELIPHDEDGLTVREIATSNIYEAVKAVTKQGTRKR